MLDHFQIIYQQEAVNYDRLIRREDYQGNLLAALQEIASVSGKVIADLGAGTGRLTRLTAPHAASVIATDASLNMLNTAAASIREMRVGNCHFAIADNRLLPLRSAFADISMEGWSFGHLAGWYPDTWRHEAQRAFSEMQRITKPGGVMILMETLGTGSQTPQPPTEGLAAFYAMLENELGFHAKAIRTDYRFESAVEAEELVTFFFQTSMTDRMMGDDKLILPECTGVWWRHV
jgi:ubiquinone/menaquinone biosynthesis C-methylase UbiE